MMGKLYCCATNCHNYSGKSVNNRKVTLHRFPVNKRHKGIWKNRISRKNWKPTSCSRLCSEHFVSLSGPTKEHPLPSIFHHKVFKTTKFDHTPEVLKEVVDNQQEHMKDGSGSETSQSDSAETSSFKVNSNQSVLDTSILLHDYCGYIDTQPYPSRRINSHKLMFYRIKVLGFRKVKVTVMFLKIMMFLQILHVIKQQVQPLYPF